MIMVARTWISDLNSASEKPEREGSGGYLLSLL